jgi:hypothetical protein
VFLILILFVYFLFTFVFDPRVGKSEVKIGLWPGELKKSKKNLSTHSQQGEDEDPIV